MNFHTNHEMAKSISMKMMETAFEGKGDKVSNLLLLEIASNIIRFAIETAVPMEGWRHIFEEYAKEVESLLLAKKIKTEQQSRETMKN